MNGQMILEMENISKQFPGVKALDCVRLAVKRGEVHALMGENGAGKSTLIKIMTGVYQRDEGRILFDGKEISPRSVYESVKQGISAIFQELNLIPYLSISENIFIGHSPEKWGILKWEEMDLRASKMLEAVGIHIDVRMELASQSTAIQQMVAIVRAINMGAKLIVMDEPTSSLDAKETALLFNIIRKLKQEGISVIFISHRLDEVFEICDSVTVLKDGRYEGTYEISKISKYELVKKMVGRELVGEEKQRREKAAFSGEYLCELSHAGWKNKLKDVSFSISKGEVLGLAGLLGSGRTESAKILFGCNIPEKGSIFYQGERIQLKHPKDAVKRKIAFCSEDRRVEGIIPNMTLEDNIALADIAEFSSAAGWLKSKKKQANAQQYVQELQVKTPGIKQKIKNLSGGNQQKVLLARWLCMHPKLIIMDEPTRGIDVGAKAEIERLIRQFASQGISILMISSELQELVRNCDRVIVLREGETVGEIAGGMLCEETIMQWIAGAAKGGA